MDQLFGAPASNNGGGIQLLDNQQQQPPNSQQAGIPTAIMVHLQYGSHREKLILERTERPEVREF